MALAQLRDRFRAGCRRWWSPRDLTVSATQRTFKAKSHCPRDDQFQGYSRHRRRSGAGRYLERLLPVIAKRWSRPKADCGNTRLTAWYPPKFALSLASKFATGKELPALVFSGGEEANSFLAYLGFDIQRKRDDWSWKECYFAVWAYDQLDQDHSQVKAAIYREVAELIGRTASIILNCSPATLVGEKEFFC